MNIDVDALKKLDVDLLLDLLIKQLEIGQAAAKQGHDELIDLRQENARLEAENDELMNGISKIQKHRADEEERAANLREALWENRRHIGSRSEQLGSDVPGLLSHCPGCNGER
jgi:predicted  nucleic acid-binding Zn-ribbon protein